MRLVLVCGSRSYPGHGRRQLYSRLDAIAPTFVMHGGCQQGGDRWADY